MKKNRVNLIVFAAAGLLAATSLAETGKTYLLRSRDLDVLLARDFPRVISYTCRASGAAIKGQSAPLSRVLLNGEAHSPKVKSSGAGRILDRSTARYTLTFPDAGNASMRVAVKLDGSVLALEITDIKDSDDFRIATVEIPDALLSVDSDQPGATLSYAIINPDKSKQMDTFMPIAKDTEAVKTSAAYAILNTDRLAAAMVNNSAYDIDKNDGIKIDKSIKLGNGRIRVAVENTNGGTKASLSSGQWVYRARGSDLTEDKLWCKVIITGDRNGDDTIDWQDGAIAFRDIMENPFQAERTPERVAQHIVFNFGSAAGEPFLRTLDNIKRVYYATDGLGQFVLEKGYQSEGHDSAHPDFGGNIGKRQGGRGEMKFMVDQAEKWNAEVGVHINCQEAYPEAYTFNEDLVFPKLGGWNWIDQSYIINHRRDITSGTFARRVEQMMEDVPGLDFIYMDVYFGDGWLSQEMARILNRAGVGVTTEFPQMLEHSATWSHWSTDITYGPDRSRGINSHIIRFIRNHQKDMYLVDPLLGHAELGDFETWQGRTDFHQFLGKVYQAALPSKYLQHFKIMKWTEHEVLLGDDEEVRVTDENGKRQFFQNGRLVLDGQVYLLPWEPREESKLYHWNPEGGESTWQLPPSWKVDSVKLYQLTDTGRLPAIDLPVVDGRVTISADAATPYVLYPSEAPALPKPNWGEGSLVKDPGFYDKTLGPWTVQAPAGVVSIATDDHARTALTIAESDEKSVISQKIKGLKPGTYNASVWVEIVPPQQDAASASSSEAWNPPAHAIDGNRQTRWCASSGAKGQWLQLDLGQSTDLGGLRVVWEKESGNPFAVAVSSDGEQWQTVLERQPASGEEQNLEFSASARYLRLDVDGSPNAYASVRILQALDTDGKAVDAMPGAETERKASLVLQPAGGEPAAVWTDRSPLLNTIKNSHWNRTRMQWMRVVFDLPEGASSATLALEAYPGAGEVRFDNIRIVPTTRCGKEGYDFYEDFEDNDEGWFPFVKGPAGGIEDPRTHLSELHAPYTQKGWNGKLIDDVIDGRWSLKAHEERLGPNGTPGLIYRTIPQNLRFDEGVKYEVSFDYQCAYDGEYEFLIGCDKGSSGIIVTNVPIARTERTERFAIELDAKRDGYWIGVQRMKKNSKENRQADLVIDNLGVRKFNK